MDNIGIKKKYIYIYILYIYIYIISTNQCLDVYTIYTNVYILVF